MDHTFNQTEALRLAVSPTNGLDLGTQSYLTTLIAEADENGMVFGNVPTLAEKAKLGRTKGFEAHAYLEALGWIAFVGRQQYQLTPWERIRRADTVTNCNLVRHADSVGEVRHADLNATSDRSPSPSPCPPPAGSSPAPLLQSESRRGLPSPYNPPPTTPDSGDELVSTDCHARHEQASSSQSVQSLTLTTPDQPGASETCSAAGPDAELLALWRSLPPYVEPKPGTLSDEAWLSEKRREYPRINLLREARNFRDYWSEQDWRRDKKPLKSLRLAFITWLKHAKPEPVHADDDGMRIPEYAQRTGGVVVYGYTEEEVQRLREKARRIKLAQEAEEAQRKSVASPAIREAMAPHYEAFAQRFGLTTSGGNA